METISEYIDSKIESKKVVIERRGYGFRSVLPNGTVLFTGAPTEEFAVNLLMQIGYTKHNISVRQLTGIRISYQRRSRFGGNQSV